MANIRYRSEFYSENGVFNRVDIIDTVGSYTTPTEFLLSPPFYQFSHKGGNNRFDPIIGTECKITAHVQNATFEDLIDDIITAPEQRFFCKIYTCYSTNGLVYDQANCSIRYIGGLLQDAGKIEDTYYPYDYEIGFSDGLGLLKEVTFVADLYFYTGRDTFIEFLIKALDKTGVMGQWGVNDIFLKTCVHWYDDRHTFAGYFDPLKYSNVDHKAFWKEGEEAHGIPKTLDLLIVILNTWGCKIIQSNGIFHIYQVNELYNTTLITRTYKKDGTYISCLTNDSWRNSSVSLLSGGSKTYFPALRLVQKKYIYRQTENSGNLLPNEASFTPHVHFNDITGGNDETLTFSGVVNQMGNFSSAPPQFQVKYICKIILYTQGYDPLYLYNGPNGTSGYSWVSSDPSKYCTFWSGLMPPGKYPFSNLAINFVTPPIYFNCIGTFEFYWDENYYDVYRRVITLPSGWFIYLCQEFQLFLLLNNNELTEGEITFNAENNQVATTELILPDTCMGDGPNTFTLGRIQAYNGSTWENSTLWRIKNGNEDKSINQLMVNEVLKGGQTACKKFGCSFISTSFRGHQVLVIGSEAYQILAATFSANNDTWQGEWFVMHLQGAEVETGIQIEEGQDFNETEEWYKQSWTVEDVTEEAVTVLRTAPLRIPSSFPEVELEQQFNTLLPIQQETIDSNSELTDYVPAGYRLINISIYNPGPSSVTIDIGTTQGGNQIADALTVSGDDIHTVDVDSILSIREATSLFFSSDSWASDIIVSIKMERVFII